jgi:hypothetical protein
MKISAILNIRNLIKGKVFHNYVSVKFPILFDNDTIQYSKNVWGLWLKLNQRFNNLWKIWRYIIYPATIQTCLKGSKKYLESLKDFKTDFFQYQSARYCFTRSTVRPVYSEKSSMLTNW